MTQGGEKSPNLNTTDIIPQVRREISYDDAMNLLSTGASIIISGMSFTGERGYMTKVVSILRSPDLDQELRGWCYQHRLTDTETFEDEGLHRINGLISSKVRLPGTMIALTAEIDPALTDEEDPKVIQGIVNNILSLDTSYTTG